MSDRAPLTATWTALAIGNAAVYGLSDGPSRPLVLGDRPQVVSAVITPNGGGVPPADAAEDARVWQAASAVLHGLPAHDPGRTRRGIVGTSTAAATAASLAAPRLFRVMEGDEE